LAWAGDDRYKVKRQPVFFFEKKQQKTFDNYDSTLVYELCVGLINKVFLLLFVHKKKIFLCFPAVAACQRPRTGMYIAAVSEPQP